MKRPITWVLLFYILGLFSVDTYFWAPLLGGSLLFYLYHEFYKAVPPLLMAILLSATLGGYLQMKNAYHIHPDIIAHLEEEVTVTGEVLLVKRNNKGNENLHLMVEHMETTTASSNYKGLIFIRQSLLNDIMEGDKITVSGILRPLNFRRNPGGYDEFTYLRSHQIEATMTATTITPIDSQTSWRRLAGLARNKILPLFDEVLPPQEAAIMKAVLLGENSFLDTATKNLYQQAGIYHILVVSGAHISIVALSFYQLLLKLKMRKDKAAPWTMIVLLSFTVLAGGGISLVRASIMCGMFLCSQILYVETDSLVNISLAALLLLLYEPLYIMNAGFLYSFSAVIGLSFLTPHIKATGRAICQKINLPDAAALFETDNWLVNVISASVAASLSTIPVSALFFYEISLIAPIANIAVALTSSFLVVAGIIVSIIAFFSIPLATVSMGPVYLLLQLYEQMSRFLVAIPFATIITGKPYISSILGYILLLVFFCTWYRKDSKSHYLCYGGVSLYLCSMILQFQNPPFQLTFLDVGQGDAIVIEAYEKVYLIDGGGWYMEGEGENTGKQIILPFLKHQGRKKLDGVFFTHGDRDHSLGLLEVLENFPVDYCYIPQPMVGDETIMESILEITSHKEIPLIEFIENSQIQSKGLTIESVFPRVEDPPIDNLSMVLLVSLDDKNILLTGDITTDMELTLLSRYAFNDIYILKLAHHGSQTSSGEFFLREINPSMAIASAGKNNIYNHPSPEIIQRLEELKIPLYNTSHKGAIIFFIK